MGVYSVEKLMAETRRLAAEYREATGKPLAVSGELASYDACRLLGLEPAPQGASGFDAVGQGEREGLRVQIKGRAVFDEGRSGHRIGQLKLGQDWDVLVLVLMDARFEPVEIYEAERETVEDALQEREGSRGRRGAMSVARFKNIARLAWTRERGVEDDGYWDNQASAAPT